MAPHKSVRDFLLDVSGSMWGRIDRTPKIGVAKQVMSRLAGELPVSAKALNTVAAPSTRTTTD